MPVYKVEIFKQLGARKWENGYIMNAISQAAGATGAEALAVAEAVWHSDQVAFLHVRMSPLPHEDNEFIIIPLDFNGGRSSGDTGSLLPLWNVMKVYLQPPSGRPDYKLYRGILGEANTAAGIVDPSLRALPEAGLNDFLSIVDTDYYIMSDDEEPFNLVITDQFIRERQLGRRRKKAASTPLSTPS